MARTRKGVCFDCRLCFHQGPFTWTKQECPSCRKPLYDIGVYFRAPARHRVKAWKKLEKQVKFFGPQRDEGSPIALLMTPKKAVTPHQHAKKFKQAQESRQRMYRGTMHCFFCKKQVPKRDYHQHTYRCERENPLPPVPSTPKLPLLEMSVVSEFIRDKMMEERFKRMVLPPNILGLKEVAAEPPPPDPTSSAPRS